MQSQKRQQSLHSQNQLPFSFFFLIVSTKFCTHNLQFLNIPKWNVNNKDKKIIYYIKAVITNYALIELVFFAFHGFF